LRTNSTLRKELGTPSIGAFGTTLDLGQKLFPKRDRSKEISHMDFGSYLQKFNLHAVDLEHNDPLLVALAELQTKDDKFETQLEHKDRADLENMIMYLLSAKSKHKGIDRITGKILN
jgi:hypothetical protein